MFLKYFFYLTCYLNTTTKETTMWTKPEAIEMRFGFEVTMYIANR